MRQIIQSKKHINQHSQGTVAQAAIDNFVICTAIEGPSTTPEFISEGAIVKACYVEMWVGTESATVVNSYTIALYKDPGGSNPALTADMAALHDWSNKKNILFTGQGLLPIEDGGIIPVMRGWYKIPKGKQRFGLGDRLVLTLRNNNATAIDIQFCGIAIFKEYT